MTAAAIEIDGPGREEGDNVATEGIHGFVADAAAFNPSRAPDFVQRFTPQQWASIQAIIRDPDGRHVSLEAQGSAPESHG